MSRLIDAEQLSKHKYVGVEFAGIDMGIPASAVNALAYKWGWNDAIEAIVENAPTVEAVEIVRCKDCKHYYADPWGWGNCVFEGGVSRRTKTSDFCSWGERKDD